MKKLREIVNKNLGHIVKIINISSDVYRVIGNGFDVKVEKFYSTPNPITPWWFPNSIRVEPKNKLYRSLPVHEYACKNGLYVPRILKIIRNENKIYKISQWIEGESIGFIKNKNSVKIPEVFQDLGVYLSKMMEHSITPCDPHFGNFIWSRVGVVCIDMKKFLFTTPEIHLIQIAKTCLKSTRSCKEVAINILKGYSINGNIETVIRYLDEISWSMGKYSIDRISLEEINERPRVDGKNQKIRALVSEYKHK